MSKKAILSLSGGLDSTSLLLFLLSMGYEVRAYSFDYGQKHKVELEKVKENIKLLQSYKLPVVHQIIDLKDCFSGSTSSLHSDSGVEIPEGHYQEENMKSTVVENRNIIFASIIYGKALAWSKSVGGEFVEIHLGIHSGDHQIYPDTTVQSRLSAELCFRISNWGSEKVSYKALFEEKNKSGVLEVGLVSCKVLEIPWEEIFKNTHTCYNPDLEGKSCGRCGSCIERLEAFQKNNLTDPIKYQ